MVRLQEARIVMGFGVFVCCRLLTEHGRVVLVAKSDVFLDLTGCLLLSSPVEHWHSFYVTRGLVHKLVHRGFAVKTAAQRMPERFAWLCLGRQNLDRPGWASSHYCYGCLYFICFRSWRLFCIQPLRAATKQQCCKELSSAESYALALEDGGLDTRDGYSLMPAKLYVPVNFRQLAYDWSAPSSSQPAISDAEIAKLRECLTIFIEAMLRGVIVQLRIDENETDHQGCNLLAVVFPALIFRRAAHNLWRSGTKHSDELHSLGAPSREGSKDRMPVAGK